MRWGAGVYLTIIPLIESVYGWSMVVGMRVQDLSGISQIFRGQTKVMVLLRDP